MGLVRASGHRGTSLRDCLRLGIATRWSAMTLRHMSYPRTAW